MNTSIPGLPVNFHANLPVAAHMVVSRSGWPQEVDSSTKTVTGR